MVSLNVWKVKFSGRDQDIFIKSSVTWSTNNSDTDVASEIHITIQMVKFNEISQYNNRFIWV